MIRKLKEERKYQVIILVAAMIISIGVSFIAANPATYKHTISILDERRCDALLLTASSTAAAVGVSAVPGDVTEPIAELFTSISSYSIIITCIVFIEKFFITIFGLTGFAIFIPVSCLLGIIYLFNKKDILKSYAIKLTIFGLILAIIIPLSTGLGVLIEKTTFKDYENSVVELEEAEDSSFWDKMKDKTADVVNKAKEKINHFIDVIAVMLITTCFIPLAVMAFMLWLIKALFNIEIKAPNPQKLSTKLNNTRKEMFYKNKDPLLLE